MQISKFFRAFITGSKSQKSSWNWDLRLFEFFNQFMPSTVGPNVGIKSCPVVDVIKLFFGGNLDFPKIKKWKKVCSDV